MDTVYRLDLGVSGSYSNRRKIQTVILLTLTVETVSTTWLFQRYFYIDTVRMSEKLHSHQNNCHGGETYTTTTVLNRLWQLMYFSQSWSLYNNDTTSPCLGLCCCLITDGFITDWDRAWIITTENHKHQSWTREAVKLRKWQGSGRTEKRGHFYWNSLAEGDMHL